MKNKKRPARVKNSCGGQGCSISLYVLPHGGSHQYRKNRRQRKVKTAVH